MKRQTVWELIIVALLGFWFLVFWTASEAQTVTPTPYLVKPTCLPQSGNFRMAANDVGVCCKWDCPDGTWWKYCGSWAEQSKVAARVATVKKAPDQLKSLQDVGKRFKIVPLTDPTMVGMPELE